MCVCLFAGQIPSNVPVPGVHFGSVPGGSGGGGGNADDEVREQDRYLPVANIARIMKVLLSLFLFFVF
jgi:hypothetical protein